jgi:hypothetical protein
MEQIESSSRTKDVWDGIKRLTIGEARRENNQANGLYRSSICGDGDVDANMSVLPKIGSILKVRRRIRCPTHRPGVISYSSIVCALGLNNPHLLFQIRHL